MYPFARPHGVGVAVNEAGDEALAAHVDHLLEEAEVEGGELRVETDVTDEAVPRGKGTRGKF